MSNNPNSYAGPYPTPESRGIDERYDAVRDVAKQELAATMAGPSEPLQQVLGDGIKNPEGEFADPAPANVTSDQSRRGPSPNGAGNSSGAGPVDAQGQQGGTEGGQAGSPLLPIAGRQEGTPLADAEQRERDATQRKGAGIDSQF